LKKANILQGRHPPEGNEIVKRADGLAQGNRVKEQTPNPILELDHLGLA
jgi:hypothetical protein